MAIGFQSSTLFDVAHENQAEEIDQQPALRKWSAPHVWCGAQGSWPHQHVHQVKSYVGPNVPFQGKGPNVLPERKAEPSPIGTRPARDREIKYPQKKTNGVPRCYTRAKPPKCPDFAVCAR